MNLQPLEDRIVVRPAEAEEMTVSGLVIPDTAKEKPQQGEVLAVGPGRRTENTGEIVPLDLGVGDTIIYSKYGGTEIQFDGEDLLILNARDVLAKVGSGEVQEVVRRSGAREIHEGRLHRRLSSRPDSRASGLVRASGPFRSRSRRRRSAWPTCSRPSRSALAAPRGPSRSAAGA